MTAGNPYSGLCGLNSNTYINFRRISLQAEDRSETLFGAYLKGRMVDEGVTRESGTLIWTDNPGSLQAVTFSLQSST